MSCSSPSACLAIGSNFFARNDNLGEFAEIWNGSRWAVRTVPNGTGQVFLEAVKCRSARWCVAVGGIQAVSPAGGIQVPVADRWNGRTWKQVKPPVPAGATNSTLAAVACSGTAACTAVGQFANKSEVPGLLAEVWNGSRWRIQATPAVSGATSAALSAVSCVSASDCEAGGQVQTKGGSVSFGVLEKGNGTKWSIQEKLPAEKSRRVSRGSRARRARSARRSGSVPSWSTAAACWPSATPPGSGRSGKAAAAPA